MKTNFTLSQTPNNDLGFQTYIHIEIVSLKCSPKVFTYEIDNFTRKSLFVSICVDPKVCTTQVLMKTNFSLSQTPNNHLGFQFEVFIYVDAKVWTTQGLISESKILLESNSKQDSRTFLFIC